MAKKIKAKNRAKQRQSRKGKEKIKNNAPRRQIKQPGNTRNLEREQKLREAISRPRERQLNLKQKKELSAPKSFFIKWERGFPKAAQLNREERIIPLRNFKGEYLRKIVGQPRAFFAIMNNNSTYIYSAQISNSGRTMASLQAQLPVGTERQVRENIILPYPLRGIGLPESLAGLIRTAGEAELKGMQINPPQEPIRRAKKIETTKNIEAEKQNKPQNRKEALMRARSPEEVSRIIGDEEKIGAQGKQRSKAELMWRARTEKDAEIVRQGLENKNEKDRAKMVENDDRLRAEMQFNLGKADIELKKTRNENSWRNAEYWEKIWGKVKLNSKDFWSRMKNGFRTGVKKTDKEKMNEILRRKAEESNNPEHQKFMADYLEKKKHKSFRLTRR